MHSAGVRMGLRLGQIDVVYYYVDTDVFSRHGCINPIF